MKLRSIKIANVRSFLEEQTLFVDDQIAIVVGPNGGGKTNLLDTLMISIKRYLMPPKYLQYNPQPDDQYYYQVVSNDQLNAIHLEKYSGNEETPQVITIEFEVTASDISNMTQMKSDASTILHGDKYNIHRSPSAVCEQWDLNSLNLGDRVSLRIVNGKVNPADKSEKLFYSYLQAYEADNAVRQLAGREGLRETLLYLPVNRAAQDVSAEVTLAKVDSIEMKRQADAMHSKSAGGISSRAIATIAQRFRNLERKRGPEALTALKEDPSMKRLTDALRDLGYEWDVECINENNNTYTIVLKKQGSTFRIGNASSGERQLLTYLLAIYALDIRDALIVIDEPELHLHPRWQKALLRLFERLSEDTGNQFVMATHSPTFISPKSVQYVSRVYAEAQRSRIVRLEPSNLPGTKHRFDAINSQNNERIFFADLVVLVEGPSDRMVMEQLLATREAKAGGGGATAEVVAVHGKMMFTHYAALLRACGVRCVIVADLDYIQQIATDEIRRLLSTNTKKIKEVIGDPASIDGETIVRLIDLSILAGKWIGSTEEWERIKRLRTKLVPNPTLEQQRTIDRFLVSKRSEDVFVLSKGALEVYLPDGHSRKDIDKLIELVNSPDFEQKLPEPNREELLGIADAIERMRQDIAMGNVHLSAPLAIDKGGDIG
jgi:energy-coupling factor transporter ATP-binding protein EcfA2